MSMCLGYCGAIYKNNVRGLGVLQQHSGVRGDQGPSGGSPARFNIFIHYDTTRLDCLVASRSVNWALRIVPVNSLGTCRRLRRRGVAFAHVTLASILSDVVASFDAEYVTKPSTSESRIVPVTSLTQRHICHHHHHHHHHQQHQQQQQQQRR